MITVGQMAPDFTLHTSNKEVKITLSELKGKNVLLLFFLKRLRVFVQRNYVVLEITLLCTIMLMRKYSEFLSILRSH